MTRSNTGLFLIAVTLEVIASLWIHPFGDVRNTGIQKTPLIENPAIPPKVLQTIKHSCLNCHSENTKWPWYSRVAPISWMMERDVSRARQAMNFSRWEENSTEERTALLTRIRAAVRSGIMPPVQYTLIHPDARLSADQIMELYNWARAESRRERDKGDN